MSAMSPVLRETCRWLDLYFRGQEPGFLPPYRLEGCTDFRQSVCERMLCIPYGATTTYGEIAREIGARRGGRMSAQAVGGAVGWNPICILIPCHRVMGVHGALTGYGGGLANKIALLAHEAKYRG
ncbi:MAG: methylated-DNA--[Victivallales bacterium]|nr:methylated-DNA--[protein]-cysteine S-methyltransferase [Victivallales bacterium]